MAKTVKGTKTEQSLKEAFAGESQANRRYLYFANIIFKSCLIFNNFKAYFNLCWIHI